MAIRGGMLTFPKIPPNSSDSSPSSNYYFLISFPFLPFPGCSHLALPDNAKRDPTNWNSADRGGGGGAAVVGYLVLDHQKTTTTTPGIRCPLLSPHSMQ